MRRLTKTPSFIVFFILVAVPFMAPLSHAKDYKRTGIFKELNLSEEQKGKLKEIKKAGREDLQALRHSKRELRKQLQEAMKSDTSDEELRKLNNELRQAEAEFKELKFEKILKIRAILNKEQREKFNELKSRKWKGRHNE